MAEKEIIFGGPEVRERMLKESIGDELTQKFLTSLAQDAARYRWLRSTTNWASNSSGERIDVRNSPELWDSAIDEAIARAALLPDNAVVSGAVGIQSTES